MNLTHEQIQYYKERDNLNIILPSIAIDIMIFSQKDNQLYLLMQKDHQNNYSLIGSFMQSHKTIEENLKNIIQSKAELDIDLNQNYKQIKTYTHPERDSRGHIITILYAIFIDYQLSPLAEWVKISQHDNDIQLVANQKIITINSKGYADNSLKYNTLEGHGYMIKESMQNLITNYFKTGDILNVYLNGYTMREAWLLYDNMTGKSSSRTNIRRKLLNISQPLSQQKLEGKAYAQLYQLKEKL